MFSFPKIVKPGGSDGLLLKFLNPGASPRIEISDQERPVTLHNDGQARGERVQTPLFPFLAGVSFFAFNPAQNLFKTWLKPLWKTCSGIPLHETFLHEK